MSRTKRIVIILLFVLAVVAAIGAVVIAVNKKQAKNNTTTSVGSTKEVITEYTTGKNSKQAIKVACIGDSITYGYGLYNRDSDSYPAVLQQLLGEKYEVINFGLSGRTAELSADKPYMLEDYYEKSKAFSPNIVSVMLGTNDTKKINWNAKQFVNDYRYLLESYLTLPSRPQVYVILPPPLFDMENKDTYPNQATLKARTIPLTKAIAAQKKLTVIDVYAAFENKPYLLLDGCHPNEVGAEAIAKLVYNQITKN